MDGSLLDGGASFTITIPSFVADFKRDESIIIKNLPDGLLNEEQRQIKQKVLESDAKKEMDIKISLSSEEINRLENQGFTKEDIETVINNIDNISKISSAQLDAAEESLNRNQAAIKEQAIEQAQKREKIQRDSLDLSR